jgi:hypothetical protein
VPEILVEIALVTDKTHSLSEAFHWQNDRLYFPRQSVCQGYQKGSEESLR